MPEMIARFAILGLILTGPRYETVDIDVVKTRRACESEDPRLAVRGETVC
jgi:hypothetical protein